LGRSGRELLHQQLHEHHGINALLSLLRHFPDLAEVIAINS
jgi:hypothetical protein